MKNRMSVPARGGRDSMQYGPDGKRFVWGPIRFIHFIGDISIVEYEATRPCNAKPDWEPHVYFHPYVFAKDLPHNFGEDTKHGFHTLDEALAFALAYKYDEAGANTRAHRYFMRGIGAIS